MKQTRLLFVALLIAGPAFGQVHSNDVPLNNNGDVVFLYSSPSVGAPLGTVPPNLNGDLYWKVLPGNGVLWHETPNGAFIEIDGYYESIFDTDWTTTPDFYDRSHGAALSTATGALEPAFFQFGWTSEVLVSLGSTGFGSPCTIAPSLCSPPGCLGGLAGYLVDIRFGSTPGSGIVIPADGTSASDHAVTYFVPGGMTASGGPCGLGDYALQDVHSTDETMVGLLDLTTPFGGFQVSGLGPLQEAASSTVEAHVTFREPMLNVRADTGTGYGLEIGDNGGGAMNALRLSVGSGLATIGVEIRSLQHAAVPNLAAVGASFGALPAPGVDVLGAKLLLAPLPIFASTVALWNGAVSPAIFVLTSEGAFTGVQGNVPAISAGTSLYLQGFVLDFGAGVAANTNVWHTAFFP